MGSILSPSPSQLGVAGIVALGALIYILQKNGDRRYPPGPPREFLIGSMRAFPQNRIWERFCEWAGEYGDLVYASMPGVSMLNINSIEMAQELLGKRNNTTSGRKVGYMVRELMGWNWSLAFMQPGPTLLEQRKMLRRGIGPQRIAKHNPLIEKATAQTMVELKTFQGDPATIVKSITGQLLIEVTYGEEMWRTMGAALTAWNLESIDLVNTAFYSIWPVDVIPILRFIPSWFPGVTFRRIADRCSILARFIREEPFARVKELYAAGTIGHSLAFDLFEEFGPSDNTRDAMATLYMAGADTTTGAIVAFIHAMYLFPEIATKVYEEIVRVTGGDRLLHITDRPLLPFTEACWKESLRWHPPIALGIPHQNDVDEMINGYLIPKGTIINANIGFMLKDTKVWGDPDVFRPERFLGSEAETVPNPLAFIFGFGMRVCPGIYLANQVGFHLSASIIALYSIQPPPGIPLPEPKDARMSDTAFRLPIGLECRFIPRDEKAENLLKSIILSA